MNDGRELKFRTKKVDTIYCILNKSVRTSSTTIYIVIKITHETGIAQQFIATYVRKS